MRDSFNPDGAQSLSRRCVDAGDNILRALDDTNDALKSPTTALLVVAYSNTHNSSHGACTTHLTLLQHGLHKRHS